RPFRALACPPSRARPSLCRIRPAEPALLLAGGGRSWGGRRGRPQGLESNGGATGGGAGVTVLRRPGGRWGRPAPDPAAHGCWTGGGAAGGRRGARPGGWGGVGGALGGWQAGPAVRVGAAGWVCSKRTLVATGGGGGRRSRVHSLIGGGHTSVTPFQGFGGCRR